MYIINFVIAITLPFIPLLKWLQPMYDLVPPELNSNQIAFVASELGAILGFWMGLLRNFVGGGQKLTEQKYWGMVFFGFIFILASKIILVFAFMWFNGLIGFLFGWFALGSDQQPGKYIYWAMKVISILMGTFCVYMLIGYAWFNFTTETYYLHLLQLRDYIIHWQDYLPF